MILISRYSNSAFKPQHQSYMQSQIDFLVNFKSDELPPTLTEYTKECCINSVTQSLKNLDHSFNLNGIFIFLKDNISDAKDVDFQLNHIKGDRPAYHEALINKDVIAYALGDPYLKEKSTIGKLYIKKHYCAYIPFADNWNLLEII